MVVHNEMLSFVRVVEKGSFAAAARELSLTPSALSKTITRLEQRLGAQLMTRTTRRLALTAEGETYLSRCREILAAIDAAESEIASAGALPRGHIRVSAGTAIGRQQVARLLPDFLATYPGISVELNISDYRVDLVAENIDVALRAGDLPDSTLVARKIVDARRLICASPEYLANHGTPVRPDDLLNHNCIVIASFPHLARWPFHTPEGVTRIQVGGNVTSDNADVQLDLAVAGHGIVRMVDIHLADSVHRGLLVPLLIEENVDEPVPIWALTPPGRNRVPRVRVFLDFLVERLQRYATAGDEFRKPAIPLR